MAPFAWHRALIKYRYTCIRSWHRHIPSTDTLASGEVTCRSAPPETSCSVSFRRLQLLVHNPPETPAIVWCPSLLLTRVAALWVVIVTAITLLAPLLSHPRTTTLRIPHHPNPFQGRHIIILEAIVRLHGLLYCLVLALRPECNAAGG